MPKTTTAPQTPPGRQRCKITVIGKPSRYAIIAAQLILIGFSPYEAERHALAFKREEEAREQEEAQGSEAA